MLKWGIIGPGKISRKFCQDLIKVDGMTISAVASRSVDRADKFAQEFNIPNKYDTYTQLAQSPHVDVVYIGTPHTFHKDHSILCLTNNKHVLCEKPIAVNTSELQAMIACAQENNCFLMEAIWTKFLPSFKKMQQLISQEVIGEIKMIQADFGFAGSYDPNSRLYNPKLAGGSLLDVGIYPLFLSHSLLGTPATIHALGNISPTGVDASAAIILKYESGALACLNSSLEADTPIEATIGGTKGFIKMHSRWHESRKITLHHKNETIDSWEFHDEFLGYKYEIEEVGKCIQKGKVESDRLTHHFSLNLMRTMDEIRRQIEVRYPMEQ